MKKSELEETLLLHIRAEGLPKPKLEHRFHPTRRWRFDFCWLDHMLAAEVEGGTFANGRHNRGVGFENDARKYGEAMKLGWTVYRCTGAMVKDGTAIETIRALLKIINESQGDKETI